MSITPAGRRSIQVNTELKERGVRLVVSGVSRPVRRELDRAGVTAALGEEAYYASVSDVLKAYGNG